MLNARQLSSDNTRLIKLKQIQFLKPGSKTKLVPALTL